ncbi:MAG: TolC family protein [Candidatus Krumholzibacteriia bacterium]
MGLLKTGMLSPAIAKLSSIRRFPPIETLSRTAVFALITICAASAWPQAGVEVQTGEPVFSLERCLQFAMDHSRELRDARLGLDVAEKQVREAWGEVFPTVDASLTLTRNLTDQVTFVPAIFFDPTASPDEQVGVRFSSDNLWNTTVSLEQPLFQAEAFIGVGAAARFRALQVERVRGSSHRVATSVRTHYYEMLLARENARLTQESLRRVETTLAGAIGLERAGLGSSYDVLRLEVELAKLQPNLRRARNALQEAERDLKVEMGLGVGEPIEITGSLHTMDLEEPQANSSENLDLLRVAGVRVLGEEDGDRLLGITRARRSDLLQARLETSLARTQLSAERATVYPKLLAFASYRVDAQEDGSLDFFGENDMQRTTNWQAGIRLEVPVWEGGKRYSRMAQRSLQLDQSLTQERLQEQEVENEVRTLLAQLVEARHRVEVQKRAVEQAQRGFEIASAEYREGLGTQINATDAEVALRETEFNYAEAIFDVLRVQAQLDAAVGVVPMVDEIEEGP